MAVHLLTFYRNYNNNDTENIYFDEPVPVPDCEWSAPAGKTFVEWNSARDGSGEGYRPGDYNFETRIFYAIWGACYYAPESALTDLADAIRSKAGISSSLVWPDGFINTINGISINTIAIDTNTLISKTIGGEINEVGEINSIGNYAFYSASLTKVNFPACISIGEYAFANNTNLSIVNFPVCTSISEYAFYSCAMTTITFPACTYINNNAFYSCSSLTNVYFPVCEEIYSGAFGFCSNLININFPNCELIGHWAFQSCSNLTSVYFPNCNIISGYGFSRCYALSTVSFPKCTLLTYSVFDRCYNLLSVYLLGSTVAELSNITTFRSTPISDYTVSTNGVNGSIYVRASLINDWKTATNWVLYSERFVGLTDSQIAELGGE